MQRMRLFLVAVIALVASAAFVAPASAQTSQEGLVNVAVEDVTVQVPVSVAANICDVNVAVLAEFVDTGNTACEATADSAASAGPSQGGPTRQEGLVNVLLDNIVVQVPVAVAANVCDVNVAVLAQLIDLPGEACEAHADSTSMVPGAGGGGRNASAAAFAPIDLDTVINLRILDGDLTT